MMERTFPSQLHRLEGRVRHAYQDHLGFLTIGDGILIDERRGGGLFPEEMDFIRDNRIRKIEARLDAEIPWWRTLNEPRRAVILGMAWQMGVNGLLSFRGTLQAVKESRWSDAKRKMLQSKWHNSDTPKRAKAMADQMLTGEWVDLTEYGL